MKLFSREMEDETWMASRWIPTGTPRGKPWWMYQAAIMDAARLMKEREFEDARDTLNSATKNNDGRIIWMDDEVRALLQDAWDTGEPPGS